MTLAFARMLWRFPRRRLRLRAEGWSTPHRTPCLFIGNNAYSMQLMTLGQRDRLDSGRLWLFLAKQRTRVGLLWFALRAMVGSIDQVRDFEELNSPTLEIDMHASRVHVATDGEVTTMRPPLHYRSPPQALRVFATPVAVA
jgi:diacylglycerol kinase family enzyme